MDLKQLELASLKLRGAAQDAPPKARFMELFAVTAMVTVRVNFVDAQGAGEVRQRPFAIGGSIGLADFPVDAVVEKTIGRDCDCS